jgi:hypothetical protein
MLPAGGRSETAADKRGSPMKRRRFVLLVVVAGALTFAVATAWAGFPNFQRYKDPVLVYGGSTSTTLALAATAQAEASTFSDPRVFVDGIVVVGIKEGVATTLTAPYEAVYVCVNGGGNVPSAANKTTLVGELESSADFPAARNGKAQGSLLTEPLPSAAEAAAATGFACPSGQVLEFDRVIFSGLRLSIEGGEVVSLATTLTSASVHGVG